MIGLYKLIFDLSVYYILAGFYLNVFVKVPASLPGFALLCLMAGLYILARYKNAPGWCRRAVLLIPALTLLFRPDAWSFGHMALAWAYGAWSLETGRLGTEYKKFRSQFLFGLRLQLLCLPGMVVSANGGEAAVASLTYLLIALAVGVCCLRCLREQASALRYGMWTAAFLAVSVLLTLTGVPDVLLTVFNWIYKEIIVRIIQAVSTVLFLVVFYCIQLITDFTRINSDNKGPNTKLGQESLEELLGLEDKIPDMSDGGQWLVIAGSLAVGVLVIALLVWMVIRLMGALDVRSTPAMVYSQKTEKINTPVFRPRLIKPRDPRGAVRYYYTLFLRECKARGMELIPGSTAQELAAQCAQVFPGADPKDLCTVYDPARYWSSQPVTAQQAEEAAQAWNRLRKTKYTPPKTK